MPKPKILLLLHELSQSGAPKVGLDAFRELARDCEVRIWSRWGGPLEASAREIAPTEILFPVPPLRSSSLREQAAYALARLSAEARARRLMRGVKRWSPDLVYVNSVAALHLAAGLKMNAWPGLLHVHELGSAIALHAESIPEWLTQWPRRYVAVSGAVARSLAEKGIDESRVSVVHSFVPDEMPPAPNGPGSAKGVFMVGGVGYVSWCKGAELWLLMAVELLTLMGPGRVRFIWLGLPEGVVGNQFRVMVRALGLQEHVQCEPYVADPLPYYRQFDVLAMTPWEESASLATLENMHLGVPVVTFAGSGGPPELVGDAGVIIPEFSPLAMARAIADLAADGKKRTSLGQDARRRVEENFTARVQVPKLLEAITASISASQ